MAETVEVWRGDTDKYGNPHKVLVGTVEAVFAWESGRDRETAVQKGESSYANANMFVLRGVDVLPRDRIKRSGGDEFMVVGGANWDQSRPSTRFGEQKMFFSVVGISG